MYITPWKKILATTDCVVAKTDLVMGTSLQDQTIPLVGFGEQNPNLGYIAEKRMGKTEHLPTLSQGRGDCFTLVCKPPFHSPFVEVFIYCF